MEYGISRLDLRGFKSIRSLTDFSFRPLNVLIGANGAGKSNLISFFKLLSWTMAGNLQLYVGKGGGASSFLHDGPRVTREVEASLSIETATGTNEYFLRLFHAAPDTFVFADEKYRYSKRDRPTTANWRPLGSGHLESGLLEAERTNQTARTVPGLLRRCIVHQFHDTSENARIRQRWSVDDNRYLKEDAGNLAPFLLRLRDNEPPAYARIVDTVRQIVPFFEDFVLDPVAYNVILQWRERGSDVVFGAHQASDGTLRTMALTALLLQPERDLPEVLILDEPELGLHPYAIRVVAGLLKSVSTRVQVILATQSTALVDEFEPEDVVVVDRPKRESTFRRLDSQRLAEWLDEYSIGELWEKNVVGGRPGR
ncbi:MAG: AAA family ATPase [Chloroflexota bacterium]